MKPSVPAALLLPLQLVQAAATRPLGFASPSCLRKNRSNQFATAARRVVPDHWKTQRSTSSSAYNGSDEIQQITSQVVEEYELDGRFERWSFLQQLLENELPHKGIEDAIIALFNGYLLYGPSVGDAKEAAGTESDDGNEGIPSPVLDDELRGSIEKLIGDILAIKDVAVDTESRFLHLFVQPPIDYELEVLRGTLMNRDDAVTINTSDAHTQTLSVVNQIERLLPDPVEDEEAHKSAWDLVIELYGREGVRVREENIQRNGVEGSKENMSWKTLCCVARVLIHYDFLNKGILSG